MNKKVEKRVEVIMTGIGGKGVLVAGELLVKGGIVEYKHTLWFPSYGAALRGGPSECTVILSDRKINSPTVSQADILIVMDPSMLKPFQNRVKPGGTAILEGSTAALGRDDVTTYNIPAMKIAIEMGNSRGANMIFLGVLIAKMGIVSIEAMEDEVRERYKGKEKILLSNMAALHKGLEIGKQS